MNKSDANQESGTPEEDICDILAELLHFACGTLEEALLPALA